MDKKRESKSERKANERDRKRITESLGEPGRLGLGVQLQHPGAKSIAFKLLMVITCIPIIGISISNLLTPTICSPPFKFKCMRGHSVQRPVGGVTHSSIQSHHGNREKGTCCWWGEFEDQAADNSPQAARIGNPGHGKSAVVCWALI